MSNKIFPLTGLAKVLIGGVSFLLLFSSSLTAISFSAALPVKPEKVVDDETVYAIYDASGKWEKTIVIDWLRIVANGKVIIEDVFKGTKAENLKGSEKPVIKNGFIRWTLNVNGERDFYYRIDTRREPPLSVEVKYFIDGKEVDPEELAGKSGKLKIVVKVKNKLRKIVPVPYTNADGRVVERKEEIFVPLLTTVNLSFLSSRFDNIKTEGGLLNVSGEKTSIMWMLFPQGEEEAIIEMDGKNIELDPIMISAFPQLLESREIEMENQFEQLKEGLEGLSILSGAQIKVLGYLEKRIDVSKFSQFASISSQFKSFQGGISSLYNGLDGINQLLNGQITALEGIVQGINSDQFSSLTDLSNAIDDLSTGLKSIKTGLEGISAGLDGLIQSNEELSQLANERAAYYGSDTTLTALANGLSAQRSELNNLKAGLNAIIISLDEVVAATDLISSQSQSFNQIPAAFEEIRKSLIAIINGGNIGGSNLPGLRTTSERVKQISIALGQSSSAISKIGGQFEALSEIPQMLLVLKETLIALQSGGILQENYLPGLKQSEDALNEMATGVGEGLEKIRFGTSLKEVLQKEAENYDTFIGKPENANGRVRFILKIEGIKR